MDVPGVVFVDRADRVVALTANAACYLRELGARDDDWRHGDALPLPVQVILAALANLPDRGAPRPLPRLRVRALSGGWLVLHGAVATRAPGGPEERVVMIATSLPIGSVQPPVSCW